MGRGRPEQRQQLEAIQADAVDEALRFIVEEGLVEVRLGAGGRIKQPAAGLIVGRFAHYTSRAGDPKSHTHCVLMNVRGQRDGKLRTLETYNFTSLPPCGGQPTGRPCRTRLPTPSASKRAQPGSGQFEIRGVPQAVIDAFSKRSADLESRLAGGRAGSSAAQKEVATLARAAPRPTCRPAPSWKRGGATSSAASASTLGTRRAHPERDRRRRSRSGIAGLFDPPEIAGDDPVRRAPHRRCSGTRR